MSAAANASGGSPLPIGPLEAHLRARRAEGRKLLVPYVTGGLALADADWTDVVRAMADAGADAIEIGIPFSDPVMDGPVIQQASQKSLDGGATPESILKALDGIDAGVPLAVMTYYNIAYRAGHERFAQRLADVGVAGCILPDLPLEETGPWCEAADAAGVETVLLAAPTAPDERLPRICARARGFVYSIGLVGITGERSHLAATATATASRLKQVTDKPVIVGIGISNPEQAREVVTVADGAVVGSALVRRMLDGTLDDVVAFVRALRAGLDAG